MNRYFTIMVIPEREKGIRSFRVPRVFFHAGIFFLVIMILALTIATYDYYKILSEISENQHLNRENDLLKEQIKLFNNKLTTLTKDIDRIQIFEKKLRTITGMRIIDKTQRIGPSNLDPGEEEESDEKAQDPAKKDKTEAGFKSVFNNLNNLKKLETKNEYTKLVNLYEQKIATKFGLQTGYSYTKEWFQLTKQSFALAGQYARFDYIYHKIKEYVKGLEIKIHKLDQYLLDKDSFLKSTPTLLPTAGWITSYYGPRKSHYAGRIKMHEGLDIGAKVGLPIIATADGVVTYAGNKPGFGKFIQIDHGYGLETIFAHARKLMISKGQKVKRGTIIAQVGSTGYSTGPHVHYEVRVNGTPVDPLYYILD